MGVPPNPVALTESDGHGGGGVGLDAEDVFADGGWVGWAVDGSLGVRVFEKAHCTILAQDAHDGLAEGRVQLSELGCQ
jgi:hypothetical protein